MGEGALMVGKDDPVDDIYQQYLESAPHLKAWAEANPKAAAKFKSCPQA